MGGSSTAVDASSRDIFLEAAFFPPAAMVGRARRFGLHTDASIRFERGVDPAQQVRAIERATALLVDIAGGEPGPVSEVLDERRLPAQRTITVRMQRLTSILGETLPANVVETALASLGMELSRGSDDIWEVTPPSFRFDLAIEADLVEEVARLVGYDNIPARPELIENVLGTATENRLEEDELADLLVARGYAEIVTYSFVDQEAAELINPGSREERLANPISQDLSVMRRSLWPGLLAAAHKNLSRQQDRLRFFEIGQQFDADGVETVESRVLAGLASGRRWPEHWGFSNAELDFFDLKGDVEALVALSGREADLRILPDEHPALRPGRSAIIELSGDRCGWIGEIHPVLQRRFDLKQTVFLFALQVDALLSARRPSYKAYSKFPSLRRDLAVVVDHRISVDEILACVRLAAGGCLQNVRIFDLYRGPGIDSSLKSVGLGLILQDTYRTLTDEDADHTVAAVVERLGSELGATIRN
jgi:phenylalanyl-tRNA synthetase beta chain